MHALITGINGQDGSYLAELLVSHGYRVSGMIRRNSICENQTVRLDSVLDKIELHYGDVTDPGSCNTIMETVQPDEIYNLAGQSHVRISFEIPQFTIQTNGVGVLNMLEAFKQFVPKARFYQASSSEMFGNSIDDDGFQREATPMHPVSPYGCAKLLGYSLVRHYRRAYGLFASNGILFNHESKRRSSNFVTAKIIKQAVKIKQGFADKLVLGNLDSQRDWGHSQDYCINIDVPLLTDRGWLFRDDVTIGTQVINFNPETNRLEKDNVLQVHSLESNGEKVRITGRGLHLVVTPSHHIYYQKKSKLSKGGWSAWKICTAFEFHKMLSNLALRSKYNIRLPCFSNYSADELQDVTDDEIFLIGALLTEGCLDSRKGQICVSISQSTIVNDRISRRIEESLASSKFTYTKKIRNDGVAEWRCNSESSKRIMEWFDVQDVHCMPRWCYRLSRRQLDILYQALMDCDGCWGSMQFMSKRSMLMADFQAICHLSGRRTCQVKKRNIDGIYTVSVISESKGTYSWVQKTELLNDECRDTWCVTTRNGTIISRDSGTVSISGNCDAMRRILSHDEPDDFVIATGQTRSVRDLCRVVFTKLNLDYRDFVVSDPKYQRPEELSMLKGDSMKAKRVLGWKPRCSFEEMVDEIIAHWMESEVDKDLVES